MTVELEHEDDPATLVWPAGHARQSEMLSCSVATFPSSAMYVPAKQGVQLERPLAAAYFPAPQITQAFEVESK